MKAQTKLNESGLLLNTPSGYIQQSRLLGIVNNCTDTVVKLSREFGLTPSSRGRQEVAPEPKTVTKIAQLIRPARERSQTWSPGE